MTTILLSSAVAAFLQTSTFADVARLTSQDHVVAATLILEAGGEKDYRAMSAVYEVIHNRAKARKLSTKTVVLQRLQFSCWNEISKRAEVLRKAMRHPKYQEALKIVRSTVVTNYTNGATHYHATRVNPFWAPKMCKTTAIENHVFYR